MRTGKNVEGTLSRFQPPSGMDLYSMWIVAEILAAGVQAGPHEHNLLPLVCTGLQRHHARRWEIVIHLRTTSLAGHTMVESQLQLGRGEVPRREAQDQRRVF